MAGLTAAGGAIFGFVSFARNRGRRRMLTSIIGFSKVLLDEEDFQPTDERVMRKFLRAKELKEDQILQLLQTSPDEAKRLAADLSPVDRRGVARYIFPLVYTGDGLISPVDRRRFAAICAELGLEPGEASDISKDYRGRLDAQWAYVRSVTSQLNYFADSLAFDGREMEFCASRSTSSCVSTLGREPSRNGNDFCRAWVAECGRHPPASWRTSWEKLPS